MAISIYSQSSGREFQHVDADMIRYSTQKITSGQKFFCYLKICRKKALFVVNGGEFKEVELVNAYRGDIHYRKHSSHKHPAANAATEGFLIGFQKPSVSTDGYVMSRLSPDSD